MTDAVTFEQAYERLEQILEKMNSGTLSLEDSLKFYEEADKLIGHCNKKLSDAETKIEMLVKNREGGKPEMQEFTPGSNHILGK